MFYDIIYFEKTAAVINITERRAIKLSTSSGPLTVFDVGKYRLSVEKNGGILKYILAGIKRKLLQVNKGHK